jgi:ATP-dependent DNA helicase RecQ
VGAGLSGSDAELFERLRTLRRELADRQRTPAYIVFTDKVLAQIATRRPSTPAELLEVDGVGPAKLSKYGSDFLDAVEAFQRGDGPRSGVDHDDVTQTGDSSNPPARRR